MHEVGERGEVEDQERFMYTYIYRLMILQDKHRRPRTCRTPAHRPRAAEAALQQHFTLLRLYEADAVHQ